MTRTRKFAGKEYLHVEATQNKVGAKSCANRARGDEYGSRARVTKRGSGAKVMYDVWVRRGRS